MTVKVNLLENEYEICFPKEAVFDWRILFLLILAVRTIAESAVWTNLKD